MAKLMQPHTFLRNSEGTLVNYNYTDVADGTGVVVLYGGQDSTGYILSGKTFYSSYVTTLSSSTVTMNFDLTPFNTPRVAKGTAHVSFPIYQTSANGITSITAQLIKSSGGSTSNVSSAVNGGLPAGNGGYFMNYIALPLTQTKFKIGDFLRLVIIVTRANGDWEMGTDPAGRNGTYLTSALTNPPITTKLQLEMPFKLDT